MLKSLFQDLCSTGKSGIHQYVNQIPGIQLFFLNFSYTVAVATMVLLA